MPRAERGKIARPDCDEVTAYRTAVDEAMDAFIADAPLDVFADAEPLITLGLHHEQQHQELKFRHRLQITH